MRAAVLVAAGTFLPCAGCSHYIAASGTDLGALVTREQVEVEFGPPVGCGETDGKPFEEYRTRRKIAEPDKLIYLCMGYVWTFGLGELIWFPNECFIAARRSVRGQTLRFTYDEAGTVTAVTHDGAHVIWGRQPPPAKGDGER